MRALIFSIFIGLLILVTTSCNTDVVFEQLEEVESSGWNYKDPVSFTFTAPDTTNKYNLIFDVRIGVYRFQLLICLVLVLQSCQSFLDPNK